MEMQDQFPDSYSVNLQEILKSKETMAVTKLLAADVMVNPYRMPREFFENISDADLVALMNKGEEEEFADMILLSQMLSMQEGLDTSFALDDINGRVDMFYKYLLIESLARKGLVKFNREFISFGEDMGDKIVVEKI
jgi:hypothetical protein